jgi:hypothetical protein
MALLRAFLLAMVIIASVQSQIMFSSFPTDVPNQNNFAPTFQISNATDTSLPNLSQLLMNLITLAKQLTVDTTDQQAPMPPPWNRPEPMIQSQPRMDMGQDQSDSSQNQPMVVGGDQPPLIFNGVDNTGPFQSSSHPMVQQGTPIMPENSQSSFPQQMSLAIMPFPPMGPGRMSTSGILSSPFGQHQMMPMMGSPMIYHSFPGEDEVSRSLGDRQRGSQESRQGSFQPRGCNDDNDDEDHGPESHGRPIARPDQEDNGGFDYDRSSNRDDNNDSEEPSSGFGHGRRPHPRLPMPRSDRDEDEVDFDGAGRAGRLRRERDSDYDKRPDMDNDDEESGEDDEQDFKGHGRRPGPPARGGRTHKKPKCKDVIRFLLEQLREKKHQEGGWPRHGGRRPDGHEWSQGPDEDFEGMQGSIQGGRSGMGGDDEDFDKIRMNFPRRMPFEFEGNDE